jgi:branched-chain amino acid transport system substrate-binding protein
MFEKYLDLGKAGKLKLEVYDTRGQVPEAISLTRKLIDSNAVAIVGPQFSSEAEVVFPLGVQGKMPIISAMSAKPGLAAANRPWTFRYALVSENDYGPLLDVWIKRVKQPIKKVVIFYDAKDSISSYDANTVFPELLRKRGISVAEQISFQKGDIDFSAQVTRAKALNPDGIIVAGFYNEAGALIKEARKQGMDQPAITNVAPNNPRFIEAGGEAVEGTLLPSDFDPSSKKPTIQQFVAEFKKRSGQIPGNAAAQIYDTLYLVADCIKREGIMGKDVQADRNKMRECWANLKDREAPLLGKTSIDENGEAIRKPTPSSRSAMR